MLQKLPNVSPPKFFTFSPLENQWLEDEMDPVLSGWPIFRCKLLVLGRVRHRSSIFWASTKATSRAIPGPFGEILRMEEIGRTTANGKKTSYEQDS